MKTNNNYLLRNINTRVKDFSIEQSRYDEKFHVSTAAGRTCENKTYEVEPRTNKGQ